SIRYDFRVRALQRASLIPTASPESDVLVRNRASAHVIKSRRRYRTHLEEIWTNGGPPPRWRQACKARGVTPKNAADGASDSRASGSKFSLIGFTRETNCVASSCVMR